MDDSTPNTTQSSLPAEPMSAAEQNWREIREKQRQLSQENELLRQQLAQLSAQAQAAPKAPEPQINPDEWVDYRTAQSMAQKQAEEVVKQQMAQMAVYQRAQYAELALKQQYPDIEQVLLDKDLQERVAREKPLNWKAANALQDPYEKGVMLYELMKQHSRNSEEIAQAKAQAQANLAKPVPGPSVQHRSSPNAADARPGQRLNATDARANLQAALAAWKGF